jgi:Calpain family cysteine protease
MTAPQAQAATSEPQTALAIGVVNPFALAEVKRGQRINWSRVEDRAKLVEEALDFPYAELFDPASGSPLYPGMEVQAGEVVMTSGEPATVSEHRTDADIPVGNGEGAVGSSGINVGGTVWTDPGDFFEETTELLDPVQGAVGDCYLIAALSSIAWARPYVIADRNRATASTGAFMNMVEFYNGTAKVEVEVSQNLPLTTPGNVYLYCRSSDPGEIWPGIYEKAYAKWRTNDPGDQPNILAIAGGDPVAAISQLTGFARTYYWCAGMTPHDIWQTVRGNSLSYKTFNPMTAWTYGTSDPAAGRVYENANLVANHAYSILGWGYVNGEEYVILRNPWGTTEASLNVMNGSWVAWDGAYSGAAGSYPSGGNRGFWRSIPLANNDGVFGLRADTFKTYFAGFGVAK